MEIGKCQNVSFGATSQVAGDVSESLRKQMVSALNRCGSDKFQHSATVTRDSVSITSQYSSGNHSISLGAPMNIKKRGDGITIINDVENTIRSIVGAFSRNSHLE